MRALLLLAFCIGLAGCSSNSTNWKQEGTEWKHSSGLSVTDESQATASASGDILTFTCKINSRVKTAIQPVASEEAAHKLADEKLESMKQAVIESPRFRGGDPFQKAKDILAKDKRVDAAIMGDNLQTVVDYRVIRYGANYVCDEVYEMTGNGSTAVKIKINGPTR